MAVHGIWHGESGVNAWILWGGMMRMMEKWMGLACYVGRGMESDGM